MTWRVWLLLLLRRALPSGVLSSIGLPQTGSEYVEVLEEGLVWEELAWGVNGLVVRGRTLPLKRLHFMPLTKVKTEAA